MKDARKTWGKVLGALIAVAAVLGAALAAWQLRSRTLSGPTSPDGFEVRIKTSDMGLGPGADLYADVVVLDADGTELASWHDPDGQGSPDGVSALVKSMSWHGQTLSFITHDGSNVVLKVGR